MLPGPGEVYGIVIGSMILLTLVVIADKVILGAMHAKSMNVPHEVNEVVSNYACRFGVSKLNVYSTRRFPNNLYFANSLFGNPSIIIGENLYGKIKKDELEVLVVAALWSINSGEAGFRTLATLVLAIYRLPMILVPKKKLHSQSRLGTLINFFIFPLNLVRFWIFKRKSSQILSKHEIFKMGASREAYSSVIYKLSHFEEIKLGAFSSAIVQNLAIADNKSIAITSNLSLLGMMPEDRYSNIMSN